MRRLLLTVTPLLLAPTARADAQKPTFDGEVLAIFQQHCVGCHGNDKQRGGLNLATFGAMNAGGASGAVIKPGDPDKSRLYTLTTHQEEPKMPPKASKIPDAQLAILKAWIEQGARENTGSKMTAPAKPKVEISLKTNTRGKPDGPPPMPQPGKLATDPFAHGRRPGAILALATSPWAPLVAVGGPKSVLLYHADSGALLGALPFEHGQINTLRFSRSGKLLLAAGGRGGKIGRAVLFNVETGEKITEVGASETDAILGADLSPDQSMIAVGGPSKLLRVYATADGSLLREVKKHTDWVTTVEFSPDGVLLASGDRNGGLFVWEAATGREFHSLRGHTAMITDLSWRSDSNLLATASEDSTVRLWEMENGSQVKSWSAHSGGAEGVRFAPDGKLVTVGRDRIAKLWDGNGGLQRQFAPLPDLGLRVAVAHDGAKVFAGDWGGTLKGWRVANAAEFTSLDANPPPAADRLKQAETAVAAAQAKVKQTTATLAAAQAAAKKTAETLTAAQTAAGKMQGELAAAQKTAANMSGAVTTLTPQVQAAKIEADKLQASAVAAVNRQSAAEATAAAYGATAKQLADASKGVPQNPDLAAAAKTAADLAAKYAAEVAPAQRSATESQSSAKTAADKHAALTKQLADAQAAVAVASKAAGELQPKVKPATDAVPAAKAAADAAAKAVGAAKAAADAAAAELTAATARLEQTRIQVAKK